MGRFFNKSEIIVIILIILLFDLNGSCFEFLNYVIYKNNTNKFIIILIMALLLLDTYIYHTVSNIVPVPDVVYTVSNNANPNKQHTNTCEKQTDDDIKEHEEVI